MIVRIDIYTSTKTERYSLLRHVEEMEGATLADGLIGERVSINVDLAENSVDASEPQVYIICHNSTPDHVVYGVRNPIESCWPTDVEKPCFWLRAYVDEHQAAS